MHIDGDLIQLSQRPWVTDPDLELILSNGFGSNGIFCILMPRPFGKINMTLCQGQCPRFTGKTRWNQCALLFWRRVYRHKGLIQILVLHIETKMWNWLYWCYKHFLSLSTCSKSVKCPSNWNPGSCRFELEEAQTFPLSSNIMGINSLFMLLWWELLTLLTLLILVQCIV